MFLYFLTILSSLTLGLTLIFVWNKLLKLPDRSLQAMQASHLSPTPRVGGIAILISAFTFSYIIVGEFKWELAVSTFPLFIIGLREDMGAYSSPRIRLIVASFSAVLGIYFFEAWLSNIDTPGLDWFLSYKVLGVLFTIFAIVGLVNAINLIDGVNGLACGQVMISSLAIWHIAVKVEDPNIAVLALIIFFSTLGLLIINFPFGFIFVGDAGAYSLGFVLAWMLVLLSHRHPEISDWSLLAVVFWPVMETLFAMFRRRLNRTATGKPDRLHFHQLVMRILEIPSQKKMSRRISNPLATVTILPLAGGPVIGGVLFCYNSVASATIVIVSSVAFSVSYIVLLNTLRNRRSRRYIGKSLREAYSLVSSST